MGDGVGADDLGRALDVHPPEAGRMREERIGADAQARSDGASEVLALGGDDVEGGRRAEVHHDAWTAVTLEGGNRVYQPVRAQIRWILL